MEEIDAWFFFWYADHIFWVVIVGRQHGEKDNLPGLQWLIRRIYYSTIKHFKSMSCKKQFLIALFKTQLLNKFSGDCQSTIWDRNYLFVSIPSVTVVVLMSMNAAACFASFHYLERLSLWKAKIYRWQSKLQNISNFS